jgi:hypothetical protein
LITERTLTVRELGISRYSFGISYLNVNLAAIAKNAKQQTEITLSPDTNVKPEMFGVGGVKRSATGQQ